MKIVNSDKDGKSDKSGLYVTQIFKFLLSMIIVIVILIFGIKFITVDIFQIFQ